MSEEDLQGGEGRDLDRRRGGEPPVTHQASNEKMSSAHGHVGAFLWHGIVYLCVFMYF